MLELNPYLHIEKVETVHSQRANNLLRQGWELLGVYPLWRVRKAEEGNPFHITKGVTFVMGRPRGLPDDEEESPPEEVDRQ